MDLFNKYSNHWNRYLDNYGNFCRQYKIDPNSDTSKTLDSCAWLENDLDFLLYRKLYNKNCCMELTLLEKNEVRKKYVECLSHFSTDIDTMMQRLRQRLKLFSAEELDLLPID